MAKRMSTDEQNLPISTAKDQTDSFCLASGDDKDMLSMASSTIKTSIADGKQEAQAQNLEENHSLTKAAPDSGNSYSKELADLRAKAKQLEELQAKTMSIPFVLFSRSAFI
jgi:hypothetical protein